MPQLWTIRDYVSQRGVNEIEAAYQGKSPEVQADFENRVRFLSQTPPSGWREPYAKQMKGNCDGLVEIKFKADGVQQRPLGYYGPDRMEFTILLWAVEKNNRLNPPNACETALARRDEVDDNPTKHTQVRDVE